MKQLAQSFAMAFFFWGTSSNLFAQVDYPYNPDSDGDGFIAVADLFEFLSVFGGGIVPPELLVDSIPLGTYLEILQESVVLQAMQLDSLQSELGASQTPPRPIEYTTCSTLYAGDYQSFQDCVNARIAEGWWAFGGVTYRYSEPSQAFVKY